MNIIDTWKQKYNDLLNYKIPQTLAGIASNPTLNTAANKLQQNKEQLLSTPIQSTIGKVLQKTPEVRPFGKYTETLAPGLVFGPTLVKSYGATLERAWNPKKAVEQYRANPVMTGIEDVGNIADIAPVGVLAAAGVKSLMDARKMRKMLPEIRQVKKFLETAPQIDVQQRFAIDQLVDNIYPKMSKQLKRTLTNPDEYETFVYKLLQDAEFSALNPEVKFGLGTKAIKTGEQMSRKTPLPENLTTGLKDIPKQKITKEILDQKLPGGTLSSGQEPLSSVNNIDPVSKIINALKEAKPLEKKQGQIYSQIRSKQAGALAGVGKSVPGEAGYFAQLKQLKGEMPKVDFESLRTQVSQTDIDELFNKVEQSYLSPFEKVTAKSGLAKLLGAEGGSVPVKSELQLLNEIFPPEFTQAILDKRSLFQKLFSMGENALNLPRAMMATADLSAPLRQGVFLIGRPKQWVPAFKDMFKYFGSENAYKGLQGELRARPTYNLMRDSKLAITDMGPLLQGREEAFMSNIAEQIPIFGRLAKGSNRAYSGFLNKLRADTFDDLLKNAKAHGIDIKENPKVVEDIAKFVNSATGRGDLGALNKASVALNATFFSPRLMASRLNLLNPLFYVKLDPFVRKEAIKSLLTFAGTAGSILGLAKLGGAEVGVDPRSADFGKIKVGDTRYDPWGGFQQYMVLGSRLLTGEMVSSTTGKEFKLGEGYKATTPYDIVQRFFESKTAPVASFIISALRGKTSVGEKFNLPVEVIDRFIPMVLQDMYDLYRENGLKGLPMAAPGVFGVGSQTYTDQIPMAGQTAMGKPNIQWRQAPGLGETILNKLTNQVISNIPKDQWASLQEQRKKETLWNIKYNSIKATVLETGEPQTVVNPITGKTLNISLENGVVKVKDVTPKTAKSTKVSTAKIKKPKKVAVKKISLPKVKNYKVKKIKLKKPKKTAKYLRAIKSKIVKKNLKLTAKV